MEPHRPGEENEDPQLNMTPMIDVVFQLMIVFLCSMKFRTLDMKIEAHLPRTEGLNTTATDLPVDRQLRVRLLTARGSGGTRVVVLGQRLGTTDGTGRVWIALEQQIRSIHGRDAEMKGEIDAGPDVPHGDVMHALDAFLGAEMEEVKFRGTSGP
ncbi:MAG: ExbD/TolR family protein [Planctomycetota bacterium]|jgi:biopolymer transport protein ExbD